MAQEETLIQLSDAGITVTGQSSAVFFSRDMIYYEDRTVYDSGFPYGEGSADERHTAEEAAAHTVINITQPGVYRLTGKISAGQIRVDLGEEAESNPEAVVTLILDQADITCTVAPAIVFYRVYECDSARTAENASPIADTSAAGANIVLAQGSVNTVSGSHVARIFKDAEGEQKLWKQDGAIYSYQSINYDAEGDGSGVLTVNADNEGLNAEMHLTINGGHIRIISGDDGINTNEDGASVTTINGGDVHIIAGLGQEGDGIDSNGWLVINGGMVISSANPASDAGLDSDMGSFVNGGTVVALGSTMDWAESDSEQVTMNLQFASYNQSDDAIVITDEHDQIIFAYDPSADEVVGSHIRRYMGAVISSPVLEVNRIYHVSIGGELTGEETAGIYAPSTITNYTGGVQQVYTGTDVSRFPGGFGRFGGFGGRTREDDKSREDRQPPEGFERREDAGEREKSPFHGSGMPQPPADFPGDRIPPEGAPFSEGDMPGFPDGGQAPLPPESDTPVSNLSPSPDFFTQDKVNAYSGLKAQ